MTALPVSPDVATNTTCLKQTANRNVIVIIIIIIIIITTIFIVLSS